MTDENLDYFIPYPEITDSDFYHNIFRKKEFLKTRSTLDNLLKDPKEVCRPGEFTLQNHQEFARNFISPETPYNGLLIFHGTGVGKTCTAITIAENLRGYISNLGKKIYILSSEAIRENFYNELFNLKRDKLERSLGKPPGSFQCSGGKFYISPEEEPNEEKRVNKIKKKIREYYSFSGYLKFANEVDKIRKEGGDIGEIFADSLIIIDEAHGIVSKQIEKEDKTDKGSSRGRGGRGRGSPTSTATIRSRRRSVIGAVDGENEIEIDDDQDIPTDTATRSKETKPRQTSDDTAYKNIVNIIEACRAKGKNIKLLLLSATPIKNEPEELTNILHLLNLNDGYINTGGEPIDQNKLFDEIGKFDQGIQAGFNFDENYLQQLSRGYVSYVRGNDPISFPKHLEPPKELLYEPAPLFELALGETRRFERGTDPYKYLLNQQNVLEGDDPIYIKYNLVKCPLSLYHFKAMNLVNDYVKQTAHGKSKEIANVCTPNINLYSNPALFDTTDPEINKQNAIKVQSPLFKLFEETEVVIGSIGSSDRERKIKRYKLKEDIIDDFGYILKFDKNDSNITAERFQLTLADYATKIYNIFKNISLPNQKINGDFSMDTGSGISYIYSNFDTHGAKIMALALEANGYIQYQPELKFEFESGGRVTNLNSVPKARLLETPKDMEGNEILIDYRCSRCDKLYSEHYNEELEGEEGLEGELEEREGNRRKRRPPIINGICPGFRQATYVIYTGNYGSKSSIKHLTQAGNSKGEIVKVFIGTKISGEGIDLKWVRKIHIMDPWHNNTRIYQAIGRGIRHCSHIDLPPDERTVTVFRYSVSIPEFKFKKRPRMLSNSLNLQLSDSDRYTQPIDENREYTPVEYMEKDLYDDDCPFDGYKLTNFELYQETIDEHTYRRVIGKDIAIKHIERVLKENAVDCKLNYNSNYYGDLISGFYLWYRDLRSYITGKPENLKDLRERVKGHKLAKANWWNIQIQNQNQIGDGIGSQVRSQSRVSDERVVRIETMVNRMIRDEKLVDNRYYPIDRLLIKLRENGASLIDISRYIWSKLENYNWGRSIIKSYKKIAKNTNEIYESVDYSRECDFQPCHFECNGFEDENEIEFDRYFNFPIYTTGEKVEADNSTYNIYFAQAQIDKAKTLIIRIFKRNMVLSEDYIIQMINQYNPDIDTIFIYLALDRILGVENMYPPESIIDRFGRFGKIIKRGNYYLFQPDTIEDTTIPIEYRFRPPKYSPTSLPLESSWYADIKPKPKPFKVTDEARIATGEPSRSRSRSRNLSARAGAGGPDAPSTRVETHINIDTKRIDYIINAIISSKNILQLIRSAHTEKKVHALDFYEFDPDSLAYFVENLFEQLKVTGNNTFYGYFLNIFRNMGFVTEYDGKLYHRIISDEHTGYRKLDNRTNKWANISAESTNPTLQELKSAFNGLPLSKVRMPPRENVEFFIASRGIKGTLPRLGHNPFNIIEATSGGNFDAVQRNAYEYYGDNFHSRKTIITRVQSLKYNKKNTLHAGNKGTVIASLQSDRKNKAYNFLATKLKEYFELNKEELTAMALELELGERDMRRIKNISELSNDDVIKLIIPKLIDRKDILEPAFKILDFLNAQLDDPNINNNRYYLTIIENIMGTQPTGPIK